jgi:hypothetical protein
VGDYGIVDRETGLFEKEGNVYRDKAMATLAAKYPPVVAEPIEKYVVKSHHVKGCEFTFDPQL